MKKSQINIAFITDDNFVIPTAVAMTSLIKHKNPSSLYNINVVATALSAQNIAKFKSLAGKNVEININIVSMEKFAGLHKQQENSVCVASEAALLKFELPNILPDYEKVLYLDGDIIVQKDVSEIYNTDVTEYLCAAVYDTGRLYSKSVKYNKYAKYFNSGVMVLNLEKMRQENMPQKLFNAKKYSTDFNLMDQDIFNQVFNGNVKILDIKYNCLIINLMRAKHFFEFADLNRLFYSDYDSFYDLVKHAVILHFSSKDKPWKFTDGLFSDMWYNYFEQSPYANHELERFNQKEGLNIKKPVIISLTSYPARIKTVHQTIYSLLMQSISADKVILWLAEEQFPNKEANLPPELINLTKIGLEIEWYHDIKSFKKLIPALQKYPEAIIVTADDDVMYTKEWLGNLLLSYVANPEAVHCHRAHVMHFNKGRLAPYNEWKKSIRIKGKASYNYFFTGVGGVLYPPHCLDNEVFDEQKFMRLCPQADDIWFWAMAVKNNTPIQIAENNIVKLNYVAGTQEEALWQTNVIDGKNDIQLQNVLREYPEIWDKLDRKAISKLIPESHVKQAITTYKLFNFIPVCICKRCDGRKIYKVLGLPVWKIRKFANNITTKYYLLGLPLMKVSNKKSVKS